MEKTNNQEELSLLYIDSNGQLKTKINSTSDLTFNVVGIKYITANRTYDFIRRMFLTS